MQIHLPGRVKLALELLSRAGYEAVIVGGCVRDALMGTTPSDYDIATSATPEQTIEVFREHRQLHSGLKHGTVAVQIEEDFLEITSYRQDGNYSDGRHPDRVEFVPSLSEDLKRRDFTINAMAYSPKTGLVDQHSGLRDLNNKLVRSVGDARLRFEEDALRIMRGLRFASVLGFGIEEGTYRAMWAQRQRLKMVSAERVAIELRKLICGKAVTQVLAGTRELMAVCMPQMSRLTPSQYCENLDSIAAVDGFETRMAALCFGMNIESVDTMLSDLRLSNAEKGSVRATLMCMDAVEPDMADSDLCRLLGRAGRRVSEDALAIFKARGQGWSRDLQARLSRMIDQNRCCTIGQLRVDGQDLLDAGAQGKQVGQLLNALLDKVIEEKLPNERGALLSKARAWLEISR